MSENLKLCTSYLSTIPNGYIVNSQATVICLGSREYTLGDLFKNFEYLDKDGIWNMFGVEE